MLKKYLLYVFGIVLFAFGAGNQACAQVDKRDVRKGNRDFKRENYAEAEIDYRKALVKDTASVAANYNLANTLFRQENAQEAQKVLDKIKDAASVGKHASDCYYNLGDAALANQDYQTAVDAFRESLLRNPGDLEAKENYIYAKKKLEEQQNQQNQNQEQNQDQNQDNQQDNQDNPQNQDNKDNQDKDDQQNDQNKDEQQDNGGQDQQKQNPQQNPAQQPKITPQAAQQMLQAIQAKEKETQDKVNKQKAEAMKSRQKEKNW